jgi:hypothetical protein
MLGSAPVEPAEPRPLPEPWATLKRVLAEALDQLADAVEGLGEQLEAPEEDGRPSFAPRYDAVFDSLTRAELYGDTSVMLDDTLFDDLFHPFGDNDRFLFAYSREGAKLAFERYGFFQLLRDRGFEPVFDADVSDPDQHTLRIWDREPKPEKLLIELQVGFRHLALPDDADCRFLFVNWLLMQNPRAAFPPGRPPFPGQDHPGLGLFPHFGYLLRLMAIRLACDGLLNHPTYFHNGVLYGRISHFVDPHREGRFRALERDLAHLDLAAATATLQEGRVRTDGGEVVSWEASDQVAPMTNKARAYFASDAYRETVARVMDATRYEVVPAEP